VLVDGLHTFSDFPFSLSEKLSLRTMQLPLPFGLPRWRKWCGGSGPESTRGERQAITCRSGLYSAFYSERAALPRSVAEIRHVSDLGSLPVIVIAHDPAIAGHSVAEPGATAEITVIGKHRAGCRNW
jgi:hypothetical protein